MTLEYRIHKWVNAQRGDVEAKFIDGRWRITDWTANRELARGTAIEVLRVLRGLRGYAQPLERARVAS